MPKVSLSPATVKEISQMIQKNSALKVLAWSVALSLPLLVLELAEIITAIRQ